MIHDGFHPGIENYFPIAVADKPEFLMHKLPQIVNHLKSNEGLQMPHFGGKRKIRTAKGLRRYLIHEEGFVFVPKNRVMEVPDKEFHEHGVYRNYLRRQVYFDPFGEDHEHRKAWQKEISEIVNVDLITQLCINGNQFTGNSIASVLAYNEVLAKRKYAYIPDLVQALSSIQERLLEKYTGPDVSNDILLPYLMKLQQTMGSTNTDERDQRKAAFHEYARERYRLISYEDKLALVHDFCDGVVNALWDIARYTNPDVKPMKIHVTGRPRKPVTQTSHVLVGIDRT